MSKVGRMKRSASGNGGGRTDNAGTASLVPAYEKIGVTSKVGRMKRSASGNGGGRTDNASLVPATEVDEPTMPEPLRLFQPTKK